MARKLYEKQAIRRRNGQLANGVGLVVYTDEAGLVPADISATLGGSAIAGSVVTTADIAGLGPASLRFYGPADGTDTLYLRVPSDASLGVQKIEADPDPRLDALESGSVSGIPGSLFDVKGDLIAASAADTAARLAVGANGYSLIPDSSQTTGLRWVAPPFINVKHPPYNAVGDGSNDDTAEIQAALDAGAGGVVFFPAGRYKISATLTVAPRTHVFGVFAASDKTLPGSGLEAAAGMTADLMKNSNIDTGDYWAHGVVIENLSFYAASGQTAGSGLRWCGGENSILRNLFFNGFPDAGIRFQKAQAYGEAYNIGAFLGHWGLWFDDADGSVNIRGLSGDDNSSLIRISNAIAAPTAGATGGGLTVLVDGVKAEVDTNGKNNPLVSCSNLNAGGIIMVGGRVADYSSGSPGTPANKSLVKISGTTGSAMLIGVRQINYPRLIWDEVTGDIYVPPSAGVNERNGIVSHGFPHLFGNTTRLNLPGTGTARLEAVEGTNLLAELLFGPIGEVYFDFNLQSLGGDLVFRSPPGTSERFRFTTGGALVFGASGPQILKGTGTPEAVVTAPVGSLFLRTDGVAGTSLYVKESGAGNTGWSGQPKRHKHTSRTSGALTLNSTSWANVDTGLDIVLPAVIGDEVEVAVNGLWGNDAVNGLLDVATIVSAAPVTYFSNGTGTPNGYGVAGWIGIGGAFAGISGPIRLTLVSGDISSGTVTLRLRYATATATNKTLYADGTGALSFMATNLGPPA